MSTLKTKTCAKCGRRRRTKFFDRTPSNRDGLNGYCKACRAEYMRAYYRRTKAKRQDADLARRYRLKPGRYDEMLQDQGGGCAICDRKPGKSRLHVDHCHDTGEVRGLLCNACNNMLGKAGDDPDRLQAGIDYLTQTSNTGDPR